MPRTNRIHQTLPRETAKMASLTHTIPDAVSITGIGRTKLCELIRSGKLDARKLGTRTLIPAEALRALIASLPRVSGR
jgi:excisionase family DNA binding protein